MTSEILYAIGIVNMHIYDGMDSEKSVMSISFTEVNMNSPTSIRTGAVAAFGIDKKSGAKKIASMKHTATVNEVTPERPPTATPDALSTKVLTVLVPRIAPITVPMASVAKASLAFGILPSTIMCALVHTPINVPRVSNISINNSVNTAIAISVDNTCEKSNFMNVGSTDGGIPAIPPKWVIPIGIPIRGVIMIPHSMAPVIFLTTITDVIA